MHISIFVYGTWGDMRPHVVLGKALQEAGHQVQVIASRGYEKWVRERGLGYCPLTTDVNTYTKENAALMDRGLIEQLQAVRAMLSPILTQMGLETLQATRESDVLMTVEFGASLLYDVIKVNQLKTIFINPANLNPTGEVAFGATRSAQRWSPFSQEYNRFSYRMIQRLQWFLLGGARNEIATKHLGLPKSKFKEFQAFLATSPALTAVSKHVFHRPSDWPEQFQVTGYLFDDDPGWMPPQDLIEFLESGETPVYIGFGSMPDSKPGRTTDLIVEAVQRSGKRAVVLKGWAGLGESDVPDTIHVLKYAPHSWLFPKMAAVIHHGGAGTTASGLRAGVPTVIVPHTGDQPYWGRVVRELGVGTAPIPRKKITVDKLAAAIQEAASNQMMRDKAATLGQQIATENGVGEAVKAVTSMISLT